MRMTCHIAQKSEKQFLEGTKQLEALNELTLLSFKEGHKEDYQQFLQVTKAILEGKYGFGNRKATIEEAQVYVEIIFNITLMNTLLSYPLPVFSLSGQGLLEDQRVPEREHHIYILNKIVKEAMATINDYTKFSPPHTFYHSFQRKYKKYLKNRKLDWVENETDVRIMGIKIYRENIQEQMKTEVENALKNT